MTSRMMGRTRGGSEGSNIPWSAPLKTPTSSLCAASANLQACGQHYRYADRGSRSACCSTVNVTSNCRHRAYLSMRTRTRTACKAFNFSNEAELL